MNLRLLAPMRSTWNVISPLIYPPMCAVTGEPLLEGELSQQAREQLLETAREPVCLCCGGCVGPNLLTDDGCDLCRKERYPFSRVVRLGRYEGELAAVCRRMKHVSQHRLTRTMAELLWTERAAELSELGAEVVVPVPLHWWTELARGSNPSCLLAKPLASRLGIPLLADVVIKHKRTPPQHFLSPTERRSNVRGAFLPKRASIIVDRRVLLVDDILTTGSTCKEVARVLLKAGARDVVVAVLARGGGGPG